MAALPRAAWLQAAICLGFVTPLFLAYAVEARHKLAFARQLRLLPPASEAWLWDGREVLLPYLDSKLTCCLLWLNVTLLVNIFTVTTIKLYF